MKKFEVIMKEMGRDGVVRTLHQTAVCENRRQVVEWYGLEEPDIIEYTINEVE